MKAINVTPSISMPNDLNKRCFVSFGYKGKRYRFYTGRALGLSCQPGLETTIKGRRRELNRLLEAIQTALQSGHYQYVDRKLTLIPLPDPEDSMAYNVIKRQKLQFDKQGWSSTYLRDMNRVTDELLVFLTAENLAQSPLEDITPKVLNRFLDNYRSSGRYCMNKRRNLSALYKLLVEEEELPANPVKATKTMKVDETLNASYTPEQLMSVLKHLKAHHPNMYLCALMTYGTVLRPHREIRMLRRKDFDATLDHITLSGKATKSGRIRKVPVPEYVKEVLFSRGVETMEPDTFVFTGTAKPLNADYFTTAWSRLKLREQGLVQEDQTLYSFRHSAAVFNFTDRQNLRLLQELMGHSTPDVTMKYLRSLGAIQVSRDDMPKLPCI